MKKHIILYLFLFIGSALFGQKSTVAGIVVDSKTGEPLMGVSIYNSKEKAGTITDINGNFSLSLKGQAADLNISYIGYKSMVVPVKENKTLSVKLEENQQNLDEVVVIGYGTQKKETMVGAVSSIKSKSLLTVPASNLTQSIAGKVSGVAVVQSSGEIGRDEAAIYIRGKATFSDENAKPLIIVDGIIREGFAQIDPNEIETINILKDASATAVYGVKGANGVVIVTTKRGITGKPQISVTTQVASNFPMRLHRALDSYHSVLLKNEVLNNAGSQPEYTASDLMKYRTNVSPYTHPDVDWIDEIMKPYSIQQQYNVNVRGGTKTVRYFISGGFFNQDSPFKGDKITKFDRYNFRSNLDIDITKNLLASINLGARIEDRNYPASMQYNTWEIYHAAYARSGRKYPAYNMDGSYAGDTDFPNIHATIEDSGVFEENKNTLEVGINLQYKLDKLIRGLSVKGQVAYDDDSKHGKVYNKNVAVYQYQYATDTYIQNGQDRPLRWGWEYVDNFRKTYVETGLTYQREFGKHNVNVLLLGNRMISGFNTELPYASQGVVGRFVYGYASKYLAEFNVGYNGSENFAKGRRYGLFPAFATGWVLSNEKFFKESSLYKIINNLKLRASLGWVGNDRAWSYDPVSRTTSTARFIYLQQYEYATSDNSYMFGVGDNIVNGIRQGLIANPGVSWETSRKLNIGIESSFFNSLINLNVDYFHELRTNILTSLQAVPGYIGTTFSPANIGEVMNQGFEVELTHNYEVNKDFSYNIKGNFSFARNKIINMGTSNSVLPYQRAEGYSIDTPLKLVTIGYFQDYKDIENSPSQLALDGNSDVRPGDLKYKDVNQDGVIDHNDFIRTGYPTVPEIQYGINFGASYKGFDFSVMFQGTANVSFDKNWEIMWAFSNGDNVYPQHWYYWTPETGNSKAQYTELYGKYQNNEAGADYTLSDGRYIRLKNLDFGYTLPQKFTEKIGIKIIRVYVSGLNLFTWSKEPYLDPDNRNNRGGYMPPMQSFNFGANINF